jgi:hypothetical protein
MRKKLKLYTLVFFSATPLCTQAGLKEVMYDLWAGVAKHRETVKLGGLAAANGTCTCLALFCATCHLFRHSQQRWGAGSSTNMEKMYTNYTCCSEFLLHDAKW